LTLLHTLGTGALLAAVAALPAHAQSSGHEGHQAQQPEQPSSVPAAPAAPMDHGDMTMNGGSAPPDARDPDAYSGGHTLDAGPYLIGPHRTLHLADEHSMGFFLADRFEAQRSDGHNTGAYEVMLRYGRDYDRLVVKAEGEIASRKLEESRTEALWSHAIASYWDLQGGVRHDTGPGDGRTWLAVGVEGLAPYWFEIDAAAYVGESGRTALRVSAEYELLLTQKLILQPRVEVAAYGKSDPDNGIGSGLSTVTTGARLRYEINRQIAPYVGIDWTGRFGETAGLARDEGQDARDTRAVAGVRFWF